MSIQALPGHGLCKSLGFPVDPDAPLSLAPDSFSAISRYMVHDFRICGFFATKGGGCGLQSVEPFSGNEGLECRPLALRFQFSGNMTQCLLKGIWQHAQSLYEIV